MNGISNSTVMVIMIRFISLQRSVAVVVVLFIYYYLYIVHPSNYGTFFSSFRFEDDDDDDDRAC